MLRSAAPLAPPANPLAARLVGVFCACALVLAAAGPGSAQHVQQQQQCSQRAALLALLADKYREAPVAAGITNNGALVEVTSARGGKTWTIIVTSAKGVSCLVAAGEGWRAKSDGSLSPGAAGQPAGRGPAI